MTNPMPTTDAGHEVAVSRSVEPLDEEPDESRIGAWIVAALEQLAAEPCEVSVRLVDKREMAALNRRYRNRNAPTNVLSFPADLRPGRGRRLLGDIVICSQVVRDESRAWGRPYGDRLAHIIVHGLLHLLGHDHAEPRQQRRMEQLERALLSKFGMQDPYE